MPFVQIALREGKSPEYLKALSSSIHEAVVYALKCPENDYFHVITEYKAYQWFIDKTYLDIERSDDSIVVYITMRAGRMPDIKQQLYQRMAENLSYNLNLRTQDLMVVCNENGLADWSFGNGVGQYI